MDKPFMLDTLERLRQQRQESLLPRSAVTKSLERQCDRQGTGFQRLAYSYLIRLGAADLLPLGALSVSLPTQGDASCFLL